MPAVGVPYSPAAFGPAPGCAGNWQTQPTFSAMIATALRRIPIVWQCPAQVWAASRGSDAFLTPTVAVQDATSIRAATNDAFIMGAG